MIILNEDYRSTILDAQFFPDEIRYGEAINDMISISNQIEFYLLERLDEADNDKIAWKKQYEPGVMAELLYELEKRLNRLRAVYPAQEESFEIDFIRNDFEDAGNTLSIIMSRAMMNSGYIVERPEHGYLEYALTTIYQFMERVGLRAERYVDGREFGKQFVTNFIDNSFANFREAVDFLEGESFDK